MEGKDGVRITANDLKVNTIKCVNTREQTKEEVFDSLIKGLISLKDSFVGDEKHFRKQIADNATDMLKMCNRIDALEVFKKENTEFVKSISPVQVLHNKDRNNTTVKFLDGSSITVKKRKEDKDCLETAIVWAVFKKIYDIRTLKLLVKNVIETGGK